MYIVLLDWFVDSGASDVVDSQDHFQLFGLKFSDDRCDQFIGLLGLQQFVAFLGDDRLNFATIGCFLVKFFIKLERDWSVFKRRVGRQHKLFVVFGQLYHRRHSVTQFTNHHTNAQSFHVLIEIFAGVQLVFFVQKCVHDNGSLFFYCERKKQIK